MNAWEMSRIAAQCEAALGMEVRQVFDADEVKAILREMEKGYLSPVLDPDCNDFTPSTGFWLVAEKEGRPMIAGGVRLDDLTHLSVTRFWDRMLNRTFGQRPNVTGPQVPDAVLSGRAAYFGDLFSCAAVGASRRARNNLRLFTGIGHYLSHWELSADVTYCFVRDSDFARGTHNVYGFLECTPFLYEWDTEPYPSGHPEWVASTSKEKLPYLMASLRRLIAELTHNI